jgi:GntR family transcriptional repressor for pyruvate dehydrogenase complex
MSKSDFSSVRSERLYEIIVRQIVDLIKEGKLKPGDRLPAERQLAITLGCSRTSLREACRVLESEGLIISKPGGGRFIQQIDQNLDLNYEYNTVNMIEKTAILHFLEVREVLEPKIVELACERATADDFEKMEKVLTKMEESLRHPEKRVEADSSFHLALAEATQNFVFVSMIKSNLNMIRQVRKQTLHSHDRYQKSLEEHRIILEAIKKGEPTEAVTAILDHLTHLKEQIVVENKFS